MTRNILEELRKKLANENLTKEEKTRLIEQAGEDYRKQVDAELNWYLAKQYGGAALEIGSAALPMGAGIFGKLTGKVLGNAGTAALEQVFGKKLVKDTVKSAVDGALASAIYGVGRGMIEDKNVLSSSLQDALNGFAFGGTLGSISGNLQKGLHEVNFQSYKNPNVLKQVGKKNVAKEIKGYYRDYVQGSKDYRPEVGNYYYTGDGIRELLTQKFDSALDVGTLKDEIKKANYLGSEALAHLRGKNNIITKFHRFRNGDTDYIFSENKYGKINFHISKPADVTKNPEVTNGIKTEETSGGGISPTIKSISDYLDKNNPATWLNSHLTVAINNAIHTATADESSGGNDFYQIKEVGSNPAYSNQARALELEPNSIITDSAEKLNPTQVAIPVSGVIMQKDTPSGTPRDTIPGSTKGSDYIITDSVEKLNPAQVAKPENVQSDIVSEPLQGYVQKSDFDDIPPANPFKKENGGHPTGNAA
ncbi:MAG: hypothetical protein NC191_05415, partial [Muribaculaceae bacterium]|nr:hypothetical protein [Muribaculaceae bacterium]